MMGRQSGQISMLILDIEELIPENHLLRKINQMISFDFIYDLVASYYPTNGRPSVDPVSMFKMLLVGYLYGIKSERRLVQEIQLNIAYRWFCGYELGEKIPDHSTFSKTRVRKWNESNVFQQIFLEIVRCCIEQRLVDGKEMAADGSYIPAEVSRNSWIDVEVEVEQSMLSYLDDLNQELASQPGFKKPPSHTVTKKITTSTTDRECGYIHHGSKRGVGYLLETTVDCKHGIVTGVDVFPANEKESLLILRHLEQQQKLLGLSMEKVALDRGYDTGAVHRGLELLGITGYIPAIRFPNDPSKYGFSYDPQQDTFICPMGQSLVYHRLNCNKSTGKYLRCYQVQGDICKKCPSREGCFDTAGARRRILASSCYPAFYRGHLRVNTPEYLHMMRKRKIWAEGSFATMKREHNLSTIHKRGILAATEECLLSAMALNLKRMVKAVFSAVFMDEIWAENMISQPIRYLCQQVHTFTLPALSLAGLPDCSAIYFFISSSSSKGNLPRRTVSSKNKTVASSKVRPFSMQTFSACSFSSASISSVTSTNFPISITPTTGHNPVSHRPRERLSPAFFLRPPNKTSDNFESGSFGTHVSMDGSAGRPELHTGM